MSNLNYLKERKLKEYTLKITKDYAITPNKLFGQNFVINMKLVDEVTSAANLTNSDIVVEVGGGIGTLTYFLLQSSSKVYVYEIDPILSSVILKEFYDYHDKLEIINDDFLTQNIVKHAKIVSNLPYNISSPFINKVIQLKEPPNVISATFQKEFANHLCGSPGESNYSKISVYSSYFYKFNIRKDFSKQSFYPTPKVDSSVVFGEAKNPPKIVKTNDFNQFLTNLFCRKHKKVRNNLQVYLKGKGKSDKLKIKSKIDNLEHSSIQPVNLTPNEILNLYKEFRTAFPLNLS